MMALKNRIHLLIFCGLIAGLLLSMAGAVPVSHIPDVQWERRARNGRSGATHYDLRPGTTVLLDRWRS